MRHLPSIKIEGVRVGVAKLRYKLAVRTRLRNLNLKSQFYIFDSFRYVRVYIYDFFEVCGRCKLFFASINRYGRTIQFTYNFYSSIKTVGATVLGGLLAWHPDETNLRCARSTEVCMPNPNSLAHIVSQISAFIRTDGQTDIDRLD